MKRRLAVLATAVALLGTGVASAPTPIAGSVGPSAALAKSCGSGYTHARLPSGHKCLRRGQFCAHSADRQYRRYDLRCTRYYRDVHRYRLT